MTGYVRKDTSNNIADGNIINAADLDAEFDGVVDAFNASTGHKHDGTTGEGAPITVVGPTQDVTVSATAVTPKTTNTVDLGSSSLKFKDIFITGTATLPTVSATTVGATTGNITTVNATTVDTTNIEVTNIKAKDGTASATIADTTGVMTIASAILTTADINSGTLDNVVIGGSTAAAASVTTLTTSSTVTLNGGTANGVAYLNGSKVLTTGSALTFDGSQLAVNAASGGINALVSSSGNTGLRLVGGTGSGSGAYFSLQAQGANAFLIGTESSVSGGTSNNLMLYGYGSNSIIFAPATAEQMRLTSTGLGIGTSSPASKVHAVNTYTNTSDATIIAEGNIPGINLRSTGGARMSVFSNYATANSTSFLTSTGGANPSTEVLRFDHSNGNLYVPTGNLGLGVTPSAWDSSLFKVAQIGVTGAFVSGRANSVNQAQFGLNAYYDGSSYKYVANGNSTRYEQNTGAHYWYTAPSGTAGNAISFTQAMTLDASGNLLIGTTVGNGLRVDFSPTSQQINGITHTLTSPESFTDIYGCGTGGTWQGVIRFFTSNNAAASERARIDSSGNLLVTCTTTGVTVDGLRLLSTNVAQFSRSNADCLSVNRNGTDGACAVWYKAGTQVGSVSVTGSATAYNTSSDYRLKHDIQPMTGALAKVAALKPCTYKWKADGSDGEGFIAHELAEVVPQCVTGEKDAVDAEGNPVYQGIDTSFLVATLTAAIQEQQAIIQSLTARVAALEAA